MNKEERANREEAGGRFKEFDNIRDLISEIRGPGTMKPCNNPSCSTCLCDCPWKGTIVLAYEK